MVIYLSLVILKGNHWLRGFERGLFILSSWLFFSTSRLKGNGWADSGVKQIVMGKLGPVLSGARVGTGVFLGTYNLLTWLVPIV